MALKPAQIAGFRAVTEQIAGPINDWLMRDAAERIAGAGKMTSTAAYELYRAEAIGASRRELKAFLRKELKATRPEIRRLFKEAARFSRDNDVEKVGIGSFDFQGAGIEQTADAAAKLAQNDFTELTQSLGMVGRDGKALPLQKFYHKSMDFAFEQVFTGAADYTTAIRQATAKMAAMGVRVVDYESGVHTGIEAATRRNLMGGLGLMDEQITQANHDALGCTGWEIDAHANSAPDHEDLQGKQYSNAAFEALNVGLTRRIGTLSCGHTAMPIFLGVNSPQYTDAQLARFKADNAEGITFEGRHYTGYEATQKQRQLETAMRGQKNRILVAEATGDAERLQAAQIRLVQLRGAYKQFSKVTGLPTQEDRAQVVGFGRRQAGAARSTAFTARKAGDILKEQVLEEKPITIKSVAAIKAFDCKSLNAAGQRSLMNAHKRLLTMLAKEPLGTEKARCYGLDMQPLGDYATGQNRAVKIPGWDVPYIAIHNHPSGLTFSHGDMLAFASRKNMKMLTAVGNDGSIFAIERTALADNEKILALASRLQEDIAKTTKKTEVNDLMSNFFEEVQQYGVQYYTG